MTAIAGISTLILLAWLFSESKRAVSWSFVLKALGLQFVIALLCLKIPFVVEALAPINRLVTAIQMATDKSSAYIFGFLGGGPTPFAILSAENNFVIAFRVLPLIIVISALSAVLFHWRVITFLIELMARGLRRTLNISGPLGLASAASVFLGTIESPLLVRPYLHTLSRADLFALITCSMSTVSGTVMVLYSGVLSEIIPNPLAHLLIASLISVPAALLISRIMIPVQRNSNDTFLQPQLSSPYDGTSDALLKGTTEGLAIVLNVTAVILVFFTLVHLGNMTLAYFSEELSIPYLLGKMLMPLMFLMGIPWSDAEVAGQLMGTKIVLNEFVAFLEMGKVLSIQSTETKIVLVYAMCGFANFASVGIIAGGLASILPDRKQEVLSLTTRSLVSGNMATLMTAAVARILI